MSRFKKIENSTGRERVNLLKQNNNDHPTQEDMNGGFIGINSGNI